jgi:transposase
MFLRQKTVKGSILVQLVASYRNQEGQPRQRVVASLGDATLPKGEIHQIAKAVERRLHGQLDLIEPELSAEAAGWVARIVRVAQRSKSVEPKEEQPHVDGVIVDQVESEQVVSYGAPMVALHAWEQLGLSGALRAQGLAPSAIATAQLMVANRLIEPLSEWALIDWSEQTALPEMLDVRITKTAKDRLYRTSDELLKCRKALEQALRKREREMFSLSRSVVLYDVTNSHFEGLCALNPKARHGKNKQRRNDCRQVAVGMAFDGDGFALGHEVFEGDMSDGKTLAMVLDRLIIGDEGGKPLVVLDAGFASEKNLALLEERKLDYLINVTRGSRTAYADHFKEADFEVISGRDDGDRVEVKCVPDPDHAHRQLVLCRSQPRREKEVAMLSRAEQRFLKDTEALGKRIADGRLKKNDVIQRTIGRLQKKHPRVARFYSLTHRNERLEVVRHDEKMEQALDLCGDYVLKTVRRLDASTLWRLYMTLLKAENGFQMLKGSLGMRPNYHQLEGRVEGHIFISVLAYHLLCWIGHTLEMAGDRRDWKTIRRLLATHSLVTTRLPLKDGRVIYMRKPSRPDAEQEQVYRKLGIDWRAAFPPVRTEVAP